MKPIDYCVELAEGRIEPPANLDIATIQEQELAPTLPLPHPAVPDAPRGDWKERGFSETLTDFAQLNARSKFWGDDQRAAFKNWEEIADPRNRLDGRQGVNERIMLRELLRRVDMMVLLENRLDALVRLHTPWPPGKIGGAYQPRGGPHNLQPGVVLRPERGPDGGADPGGVRHARSTIRSSRCRRTACATCRRRRPRPTTIPEPGLPFSLVFRGEPGREDVLLKIASAYEAASKRRIPPPAFGIVPRNP